MENIVNNMGYNLKTELKTEVALMDVLLIRLASIFKPFEKKSYNEREIFGEILHGAN